MSDGGTLPLPPLKPAAAATLVKMAKLLSEGFTGRLAIRARDGDVLVFEASESMDGRALLEYARNGPAAHRRRTPGS